MSIIIRKLNENDIEQAINLCDEIREYHRQILNGYFNPIDREFERNALLSTLNSESSYAFVAEDNSNIVGILIADRKNAPYLEKPLVCHVGTFGVTQKYRKQGIGKKLFDEFLKFCRQQKIQEVKLSVFCSNKAACEFYKHYGFQTNEQKMSLNLD